MSKCGLITRRRQSVANLTGQGIYQKTGKPAKKPKGVRKVSAKRAAYRKSGTGKLALLYMGLVKMLPCAVTGIPGPCDAHHPCHDRFGTRKASDFDTIPLSKPYHQDGPEAIHTNKSEWRDKHGPDHSYIEQTRQAVLDMVDQRTHDRLVAAFLESDEAKERSNECNG